MDCSPPSFSVHGILQARILEWVAIPFSRGSSWPRDQTWVSCISGITGALFTFSSTREASNIIKEHTILPIRMLEQRYNLASFQGERGTFVNGQWRKPFGKTDNLVHILPCPNYVHDNSMLLCKICLSLPLSVCLSVFLSLSHGIWTPV